MTFQYWPDSFQATVASDVTFVEAQFGQVILIRVMSRLLGIIIGVVELFDVEPRAPLVAVQIAGDFDCRGG